MSSGYRATTSAQGPRYQGYPYVNPPSFGVPSIDPHTASRWANLPRRPIGTAVRVEEAGTSGTQNVQDSKDESISYKSDDEPVLYIDLPEDGDSELYVRNTVDASPVDPGPTHSRSKDDEEAVVYIDIPEDDDSIVSERRPVVEDGPSTSVVQETIFYDQFKNRRIEIPLTHSGDQSPVPGSSRRPNPPTSLSLWSSGNSETTLSPRSLPHYSTPDQYRGPFLTPDEDFRLSPLPVSEFPEPPPAYTEIDLGVSPTEPTTTEPQRTRVIMPMEPGDSSRKVMTCNHCHVVVHSLVVRQTTAVSHVAAGICCILGMFPAVCLIYCFDFCKPKVHYCPNCNKKITDEWF